MRYVLRRASTSLFSYIYISFEGDLDRDSRRVGDYPPPQKNFATSCSSHLLKDEARNDEGSGPGKLLGHELRLMGFGSGALMFQRRAGGCTRIKKGVVTKSKNGGRGIRFPINNNNIQQVLSFGPRESPKLGRFIRLL